MKTKEILSLDNADIMRMSKTELKTALQQVNNVANIRLKKLESLSIEAPSIAGGVKKFSTRGKDLNQLRAEFVRVSDFMKGKTSTIPGFKAYRQQMNELTGGAMSASINVRSSEAEQETKMWNLYNRLKEVHPGKMMTIGSSPEVMKKLKEEVDNNPDMSLDELVSRSEEAIEQLYAEGVEDIETAEAAELAGASEFLI